MELTSVCSPVWFLLCISTCCSLFSSLIPVILLRRGNKPIFISLQHLFADKLLTPSAKCWFLMTICMKDEPNLAKDLNEPVRLSLSTAFFTSLVEHGMFFGLSGPAEGKAGCQHGWLWQLLLPCYLNQPSLMWPHKLTPLHRRTPLLKVFYLQHFHTVESCWGWERGVVLFVCGGVVVVGFSVLFVCFVFLWGWLKHRDAVCNTSIRLSERGRADLPPPNSPMFTPAQPRCGWKRGKGCICSPIPCVGSIMPLLMGNKWLQLTPASSSGFVLLVLPVVSMPNFKNHAWT